MAKKKKNFIVAYLTPFGIKQICDILMIVAAIVLIVGLFIVGSGSNDFAVATVGSILMALGAVLALTRTVSVLLKNPNRRSMAYKNAIINTVIMGVILALSVFAIIFIFVALV